MGRRAVFLDRDGVLDDPVPRYPGGRPESPLDARRVNLAEGAVEGVLALRSAGFVLVVVSNQPAAAKGECSLEALDDVHHELVRLLKSERIELDGWYYCYHHPEGIVSELRTMCRCRKPEPGLLLTAAEELDLDLEQSWMIGDSDADLAAGRRAGCRTVLVEHPASAHRRGLEMPSVRVPDLRSAYGAMHRLIETERQVVAND